MPKIIVVEKTGTLREINLKTYTEEELYKKYKLDSQSITKSIKEHIIIINNIRAAYNSTPHP
jgi:cystathionine beta-lyase family protein involved in aluminum resistance